MRERRGTRARSHAPPKRRRRHTPPAPTIPRRDEDTLEATSDSQMEQPVQLSRHAGDTARQLAWHALYDVCVATSPAAAGAAARGQHDELLRAAPRRAAAFKNAASIFFCVRGRAKLLEVMPTPPLVTAAKTPTASNAALISGGTSAAGAAVAARLVVFCFLVAGMLGVDQKKKGRRPAAALHNQKSPSPGCPRGRVLRSNA